MCSHSQGHTPAPLGFQQEGPLLSLPSSFFPLACFNGFISSSAEPPKPSSLTSRPQIPESLTGPPPPSYAPPSPDPRSKTPEPLPSPLSHGTALKLMPEVPGPLESFLSLGWWAAEAGEGTDSERLLLPQEDNAGQSLGAQGSGLRTQAGPHAGPGQVRIPSMLLAGC